MSSLKDRRKAKMASIEARIERGVAFLNAQDPLWKRRIDRNILDIASGDSCVLAQLFGYDFAEACHMLGISFAEAVQMGFEASNDNSSFDADEEEIELLTLGWLRVLAPAA